LLCAAGVAPSAETGRNLRRNLRGGLRRNLAFASRYSVGNLLVYPFEIGWIGMRRLPAVPLLASTAALAIALAAPGATAAQEVSDFLAVGEMAPDIQVVGATRYGTVSEPVKLSDFRGETLILAFFFRARSGG
jgi:hypothetical protein